MKIVITGSTGLIGSRFIELLFETHELFPLSSSKGVDITNKKAIKDFMADVSADAIIHLAAKTNVDDCEADKDNDMKVLSVDSLFDIKVKDIDYTNWEGEKTAFAINTIGTKNLYEVAKEQGLKFIYISTDFVFSGNNDTNDETSIPSPVNWYGATKYLGETVIGEDDLIVRISFPYGHMSPVKKDLVWGFVDLLSNKETVSIIDDQIITPTFIDDVVYGINFLLKKEAQGIYHLTGSSSLSPYDVAQKIKKEKNLSVNITASKLADVYRERAPRPFKSVLKNDKLVHLGFTPKSFDEGLKIVLSDIN